MQFHVAQNGEKTGPFDRDAVYRRLVAGELKPTDLGWSEGMAEWEPLSKLIPPQTPPLPAASAPVFGPSAAKSSVTLPNAKTSGLAVGSMICGILGLLLWLPCIPAIILGHLGLSAIKKSAGALKGSGMAVTGLVTGYIMIAAIPVIAILASLAVPAFTQVQQKANQVKAMSNAKQLVIGMKQYAADHDGKLPPSLETLYEEDIVTDRKLLEVPGTNTPKTGWEYRGAGLTDYSDGNAIVLISRESYRRGDRVVAHLNHVVQVERGEQMPKEQ